ncbi:MAG: SprT family zinc-dependent metalloprotease [Synechococcus sp.]
MPLEPLLPLFHRLNRNHFDGALAQGRQPLLALRWSDGRMRRTAGIYRRGPGVALPLGREIVLSRPLLAPLPRSAIESTLCHEMIHAWVDLVVGVRESHGPHFRARMAAINRSQCGFEVSIRHRFPVPATPVRWIAVCPSCGRQAPYRRRVRNAACRSCCDWHHGGQWHASCVLRFEPIALAANAATPGLTNNHDD